MASKYKAENEKDCCVACGVCVKVLTVIYRPRTWYVFCPMGNMTQMICKLKK